MTTNKRKLLDGAAKNEHIELELSFSQIPAGYNVK
jgi:hypothetical protein